MPVSWSYPRALGPYFLWKKRPFTSFLGFCVFFVSFGMWAFWDIQGRNFAKIIGGAHNLLNLKIGHFIMILQLS